MNRTIRGVDYSFDRANLAELKRLGYKFVIRYLTGSGKALTVAERKDIEAHGLGVMVVYETTAGRAGDGRAAGAADARTAERAAINVGFDDSIPIFLAVDFDASFAQVKPYFEGASPVLGKGRRGAYASGLVLRRLVQAGLIDFAWEAGARSWGDGRRFEGAHILQDPAGHVANASVDVNHADPSALQAMRPLPKSSTAFLRARLKLRRGQLRRVDRRISSAGRWRSFVQSRITILEKELKK